MTTLIRHPLARFAFRRMIALVVILVFLVLATFMITRLIPGDPAVNIAGIDATQKEIEQIRQQLDLNRPLPEQFEVYVTDLLHGNLGRSFSTGQPVSSLIVQRLGSSLQLAGASLAIVIIFGMPLGLLLGAFTRERRHPRTEVVLTGVTSVLGSLPEFLTATFLAFIFAVSFRLLPVAGASGWKALILPALAVSIRPVAIMIRIVRVETLNTLASDFIRTARGKRLPRRVIYLRHALPNVLTAALPLCGLLFAGILGSAVVVENVFARPGLGTALVEAVTSSDYPVIQGVVLVLGIVVVVANALVDLIQAAIDPRTAAGKV